MRKLWMVILLAAAMVVLAACGEAENKTSTGAPGATEASTTKAPSNDKDLFVAVVGEASNLNSFSIAMTADQQMEGDGGVAMNSKTESTMDIILKPDIAFKQITKVDAEGQTQEIESYYSADGFIMKDPTTNTWMKLPDSMMELALQGVDQQALDPSEQLAELLDYAEQFSVEEKDGVYTFTLKAQGEAFNDLIQQKIQEQQNVWQQVVNMDIHALEYVVQVDKSSNHLLAIDVITDMSMTANEATMNIKSDIKTTYSNHNAIEEIAVPEEALNAEEISIPDFSELAQ